MNTKTGRTGKMDVINDHPEFPDPVDQTHLAKIFGEKYNVVLRNIVKQ